jgi:hypothetical protein
MMVSACEEPREKPPFRSEQKAAQSRAHESNSTWLGYHASDGIAAKNYWRRGTSVRNLNVGDGDAIRHESSDANANGGSIALTRFLNEGAIREGTFKQRYVAVADNVDCSG